MQLDRSLYSRGDVIAFTAQGVAVMFELRSVVTNAMNACFYLILHLVATKRNGTVASSHVRPYKCFSFAQFNTISCL